MTTNHHHSVELDPETFVLLTEVNQLTGGPLSLTIRMALDVLNGRHYAQLIKQELAELRGKPDAWSDYLAEAEAIEVFDGLER